MKVQFKRKENRILRRRRALAAAAAALMVLCSGAAFPAFGESSAAADPAPAVFACPSVTGALHVEGTQLVGSGGQPVQLRGVSTHGLAWFPQYVNEACLKQMRQEWGANVFRIAMYTDEYGGDCSGGDREALKQKIREGVLAAQKQDLYVILDWHVLNDRDPNKYAAEAKAFFNEMAGEFAGMDHVLYEICNEPNGGTSWQQIRNYAAQVIPVIRGKDPNAVILVGTPNWSQQVDQAAADPIRGYDNIMYTLHFYAATHKDDLRQRMTRAVQSGLPVFVSEFGICDASGNGAIDEAQADRWVKEMDRLGVSYVMWSLCNKAESASVIASSCTKTSGFTESDLAAAGKWLRKTLIREAASEGSGSGEVLTNREFRFRPKFLPGNSMKSKKIAGRASQESALSTASITGGLTQTAALRSSWEENGKAVRLYDVKVVNGTKKTITGWSLSLDLGKSFELRQIWGAKGQIKGNTLTLTPESYNRTVGAGEDAGEIGFILVER